jgi:hypothetical protein
MMPTPEAWFSMSLSLATPLSTIIFQGSTAATNTTSLILVKCVGERSFSNELVFKIVKPVIIKRFFPNLRKQAILVFLPQLAAMRL